MTTYLSYDDIIRLEHPNLVSHDQWTKLTVPKSEQPIFYVYVYLDPTKPGLWRAGKYKFKYEPFYVGKGHGPRAIVHLTAVMNGWSMSKEHGNRHKNRRIRKILRESNSDPVIQVVKHGLTDDESKVLESWCIKTLGRRNTNSGPLTNLTDGGEGTSGKVVSLKERRNLSKKIREYWSSLSAEERRRRGELFAAAYANQSAETKLRAKEKFARTWSSLPEEYKRRIRLKQRKAHRSRSEEAKDLQRMRSKATYRRKSDEELVEICKRKSEGQKRRYAAQTPEQKEAFRRTMSEAAKKREAAKRV